MNLNEFDLIKILQSQQKVDLDSVMLGIGDDGAVVNLATPQRLVFVMDALNEGVHFPVDTSPYDLGWKSLAVNLSDLAAMAAAPLWITLSLSLPRLNGQWVTAFAAGLFELANQHGVQLIGGDLCRGPLSIVIQATGKLEGNALARKGAKANDLICVSGTLGAAAAALDLHRGGHIDSSIEHYLNRPVPQVKLGSALAGIAHSCIDISDGLLQDLNHLCSPDRLGVSLSSNSIPIIHHRPYEQEQMLEWALTGGDDYQLLFSIPESKMEDVQLISQQLNIPIHSLGRFTESSEFLIDGGQYKLPDKFGFEHFKS